MGVTTIRLNDDEQKVLDTLVEHYGLPQSTLLKKAMFELYEGLLDKRDIEMIERERKAGNDKWFTFEEIKEKMADHPD
ncbi:MAG: hypothetical protein IEMM0008_1678 [bacterium]|nr:MAG: hypothetical protein IEMM0008_1678 [bacterium]